MTKIDGKKIIKPGTTQKEFSPKNLEAYAQQNIEKYVDEQLKQFSDRIEDKIDKKETKTTEILAIFITLFTFISVNVNIFTRVQDLHTAVWFILLFTGCCLFLLANLFLLISKERNWYTIIILLLSFLLLIGILLATKYIPSWNPQLNQILSERK